MRQVALCITFIFVSHGFLLCQNSFGLSLGVDYTKTRFKTLRSLGVDADELANNGFSNPSLSAGLFIHRLISNKLILEVSGTYTKKKDISRFDPVFEASLTNALARVEFGIVSTSGIVKYKIHDKWHAGLGLNHRYIINSKTILLDGEVRKSSHNRTNMALIFGASYQYKQFFIDVSYAKGQNFDIAHRSAFFNIVESIDNLELSIRYTLIKSKEKKK